MAKQSEPAGCLGFLFSLLGSAPAGSGSKGAAEGPVPYVRRQYLLSRAERSFFGVLQRAVGSDYLITIKPRVADFLKVRKGTVSRQSWQNRIDRKHVDFLLCSTDTVSPVLSIELDDASHDQPRREARDSFIDSAHAAAGLPILHVRARQAYNVDQLRREIDGSVGQAAR